MKLSELVKKVEEGKRLGFVEIAGTRVRVEPANEDLKRRAKYACIAASLGEGDGLEGQPVNDDIYKTIKNALSECGKKPKDRDNDLANIGFMCKNLDIGVPENLKDCVMAEFRMHTFKNFLYAATLRNDDGSPMCRTSEDFIQAAAVVSEPSINFAEQFKKAFDPEGESGDFSNSPTL